MAASGNRGVPVAPVRFAMERFVNERLEPCRFALDRFAPAKFQLANDASLKLPFERSTPGPRMALNPTTLGSARQPKSNGRADGHASTARRRAFVKLAGEDPSVFAKFDISRLANRKLALVKSDPMKLALSKSAF